MRELATGELNEIEVLLAALLLLTDQGIGTIELAKLRTQIKKLEKQLSVRDDAKKRLLLDELNQQLNACQGI